MKDFKDMKEAVRVVEGFKKRLLAYNTKVTEAGYGYVMGDHLTRLINASIVYEFDVILEEIEIIKVYTGIDFD